MISKELGKTGVKIPAIGIGTWKLGVDPQKEMKAIKYGISLGMRFVDTAEMYHTEGLVGEAVRNENDVFIATKVSPHHFRYNDVINSCDQSLKNLGIKTIDLYQLHWPNSGIPIAETMKAMEQLVKDGKVRYIGVSNFSVEELTEAQGVMKSNEIASNQLEYSLFARQIEDDILPYCSKERITVIAYSPLARGEPYREGTEAFKALSKIAGRHGRTNAQVLLNWLISKPNVVAIPKAASEKHMGENADSGSFKLSKEDLEQLESIKSDFVPVSSRVTGLTKRTASLWSGLMDKREGFRSKFKI